MRKILLIITAVIAASVLYGCNNTEDIGVPDLSSSVAVQENNVTQEMQASESTLPERDRTVDIDKEFIFDDADVLSSADFAELNEYTAWIAHTYKLNTAVVITKDIGGQSAEKYAEEYYNSLYGSSNGVMFLVNNDTGTDYILKKGAPSKFFDDESEEQLFSEISPLLVTGNYKEAINMPLEFIDLALPEFAVDRTNKMSREEIESVNSKLSDACGDGESLTIIFIGNIGEKDIKKYAVEQAEKYLENGKDSALMTININNGEYYVCSQGKFENIFLDQDSIKESIDGCISEKDGKRSFDYIHAAEIFAEFAFT